MSGYTDDAVIRDGQLAQGVMFLQKPFQTETLAEAIRRALAERAG
jgi:FixJ family two-component response regulator